MITVCIATYGEQEWEGMAEMAAWTAGEGVPVSKVHLDTANIAAARNAAAEQATTDWLCFLDADDQLASGYTTWMERAIHAHPGGETLFTPAVSMVRKGRQGPARFFPECDLSTGNWLVIGTVIRRQFFLELGGFRDLPHGLEDWNLWARAVRAGAEIVKVKRAVYLATFNRDSKHHQLRKNPREYAKAYHAAYQDAWG